MKKSAWLSGFIALSVLFGVCAVIIGNADEITGRSAVPAGAGVGIGGGGGTGKEIGRMPRAEGKTDGNDGAVPLIVIDPGHGGEDGGCSAADGTLEKEINLLQSESLRDMLCAMGIPAAMTRCDDCMLYSLYGGEKDYTGRKKVFDLRNRIRFASESGALAMISIHMNKFPDGKYRGTQVYYSPDNDGSCLLADCIQNSVSKNLQPENSRLIKKGGSNIYLLNRAEITTVLCECGFLSNKEETELLKTAEYRNKLSLCISSAVCEWLIKSSSDKS